MKTRNHLLIVVCVALLAGPVLAAPPLARRIPSGALAYFGWAGTDNPAFAKSTFGQLLKDPACGKIFAAVKNAILADMRDKDERKAFGHVWPMLGMVARHPVAIAWTGLHETQRAPIPKGGILVDLGADRKAFAAHLDALIALVPERDREDIKEAKVGKVTYRTIKEGNDPEVSFGFIGRAFFVTLGPGSAADFITVKRGDSLESDKKFASRMKEVGGKGEQFSMYLDVTGIRKVVEPLILAEMGPDSKPTPAQVLKIIGLDRMEALAAATRFVDGGMASRTKIFSPAPHRGLLMLFDGKALTKADLSRVPADADFVCAANVSPSRLWKEIRAVVTQADPKAEQQMAQGLAQLERAMGLSIEKDILDNLGDTWVLSSAASQGGFLTGTVVTGELKDERAFGVAVLKIEAFFEAMLGGKRNEAERAGRSLGPQPSIETVKVGKGAVKYVALPMGPIPVAPAWAIHKGRFYLALFPQVIQAAIENEGTNPLTGDTTFASHRAKVSKNASMLSYVNTPNLVGQVYHWALILWTMGANAGAEETGLPIKPSWLPAMSKLSKYLPPYISASSADKTGILIEERAATP